MLGIVLFPEYLSIKLQSRTVAAALEAIMKMWDRRRAGRIPDQDTEGKWTGSKREVLRAARRRPGDLLPAAGDEELRGFQRPSVGLGGTPHRDTSRRVIEQELWTASLSETLNVRR